MLKDKLKKACRRPGAIPGYLKRVALRALLIRTVHHDSRTFYRYHGVLYPEHLANQAAAPFIFERAQRYCQGRGIDVGAGASCFPGATPIQNEPDQNAYRLDRFADGSLDYVFSSHCLEHLEQWRDALQLWIRKLKSEGILFLYLPHESMALWRPGGLWAGPDHKWSPTVEVVSAALSEAGMEIVESLPGKDDYWSFYIIARK